MTWGFLASFGGVVLVMGAMLLVERLLVSRSNEPDDDLRDRGDLAAALTRAEAATREAEKEIATARSIAIRS